MTSSRLKPVKLPTRGKRLAASGWSLYSTVATSLSPAPIAYNISVACGTRVKILCAGCANVMVCPLPS